MTWDESQRDAATRAETADLMARFDGRGLNPSGAAIISTSYGMNGNEGVLPSLISNSYSAYECNAIVFGAILARLSVFSEAKFAFRDLRDKSLSGSYEVDGRRNTALRKLEIPWPDGTTGELLARMIQDADLAGNAYVRDAGEQLVRLRPDWVTIVSTFVPDDMGRPYRRVIGYYYDPPPPFQNEAGPPAYFTVDEVAHWSPNPDPRAMFRGMSWLTPVIREIMADNAMTDYKIKYLTNAASPNLLIKYAQKLGDRTVRNIAQRVQDRHGGVENAFGTLVLDEGADVTTIGNSLEEMNFSTVQAAGENRIIIASGVPGIVIGSKEGLMAATYSNYEQAMRRFADVTMRPLWRSVCACLANLVTVPPGTQLWYDISDIAALRQGEQEQAETMKIQSEAISALVAAGYEPKSVVAAISSGDMTLLTFVKKPNPPAIPPQQPPVPAINGNVPVLNGVQKATVTT